MDLWRVASRRLGAKFRTRTRRRWRRDRDTRGISTSWPRRRRDSTAEYPRPGHPPSTAEYPRPGRPPSTAEYPRPGRPPSSAECPRPGRPPALLYVSAAPGPSAAAAPRPNTFSARGRGRPASRARPARRRRRPRAAASARPRPSPCRTRGAARGGRPMACAHGRGEVVPSSRFVVVSRRRRGGRAIDSWPSRRGGRAIDSWPSRGRGGRAINSAEFLRARRYRSRAHRCGGAARAQRKGALGDNRAARAPRRVEREAGRVERRAEFARKSVARRGPQTLLRRPLVRLRVLAAIFRLGLSGDLVVQLLAFAGGERMAHFLAIAARRGCASNRCVSMRTGFVDFRPASKGSRSPCTRWAGIASRCAGGYFVGSGGIGFAGSFGVRRARTAPKRRARRGRR